MSMGKKIWPVDIVSHQHILLRYVIVMVALLQMAFPFLFF